MNYLLSISHENMLSISWQLVIFIREKILHILSESYHNVPCAPSKHYLNFIYKEGVKVETLFIFQIYPSTFSIWSSLDTVCKTFHQFFTYFCRLKEMETQNMLLCRQLITMFSLIRYTNHFHEFSNSLPIMNLYDTWIFILFDSHKISSINASKSHVCWPLPNLLRW